MELNNKLLITGKDGENYTIRRLRKSDCSLLQTFGGSLSEKSTSTFLPHAYDDRTVDAILDRSEAGNDLTMGLFHEGMMAAYFFLWYFDKPIPLLGIGILDQYQGRGLSKKLIQVLIDAARENGRDGIELTTLPDNQVAYQLYESMGFNHYADVENIAGNGCQFIERAMFLQFNLEANPSTGQHKPPVDFFNSSE